MPASYPVQYRSGIHLPAARLWLDARQPADTAVISHAHTDHVGRHGTVVCTEPTWRVLRQRRPGLPGSPPPARRILGYGERLEHRDAVISLHPAGHVLGSAQTLVEHRGLRILYSGDIRLRPSRTAEPLQPVRADVLVVEATFGRPQYRFPPQDEVVAQICEFCTDAVRAGVTPILFGYALGKGQELLACLAGAGLPLVLHGELHELTAIYRALGVPLPATLQHTDPWPPRSVHIVPPHLRDGEAVAAITPRRTAFVSGWAVDPQARWRHGCDVAFPLSDHADFDELLRYVETAAPQRVYTVFGLAGDLAHQLRRRGWNASALSAPEQLQLTLAG